MRDKLESIIDRYNTIEILMTDQETLSNPDKLKDLAREYKQLEQVVITGSEYIKILDQIIECELIIDTDDSELKDLAAEDLELNKKRKIELEDELKIKLLPKDPLDNKNIILEIRAGTGGDEAALFAADLFRVYTRYAERKNWKCKVMDSSDTVIGGIKEAIVSIQGNGAFGMLKYESGVHRVQRVPKTETQGRIHTSAATVAVLPEVDDVEIEINPGDLRIDVYRSSGPGGQSVNTTDSAVRITHIPTELVVICQNEKSQLKNKNQALKVLRARLYEKELEAQQSATAEQRRGMVGSGDRSERIRTYNFPQGRPTDHRINLTLYKLEDILLGNLELVIDPLLSYYQAELLKAS